MQIKNTLMIHEALPEFTQVNLEDYVLTFDDGLYSQYVFYNEIKHINTPKIFFISSGIICSDNQSTEFITCRDAHQKAFKGNYENYMTVEQIKYLMEDPLVTIGAHSHSHTRLSLFKTLAEKVAYIKSDAEKTVAWFESNLGFKPTSFCFPYNEDLDGLYKGLLTRYGFTDFYGSGRIPIEMLLRSGAQLDIHDTLPAWSLPRYS
jgi:peptidoglycan/xylan/chitin deacetylase (PgdA/CDA1 family)